MKSAESSRKETRLVARTSTEVQEVVQRAAELSGATVSQFLVEAALDRAHRVIEEGQVIRMNQEGTERMLAALEQNAGLHPNLERAARNYRTSHDDDSR